MPAIETRALTKTYGSGKGIRDVSLQVQEGEMFGFLGPNGAGKTTTIRVLLDFLRPHSGTASVLGLDCQKDSLQVRSLIGFLPGEVHLEERLTGTEVLDAFARFRGGVDPRFRRDLCERLDIASGLARPIRTYSKGMKQKIALVQALMHRPRLLILDEPTEGLDPLIQRTFFQLLTEARTQGATVFMSSHVLSEVERTCDRVALIRSGRLLVTEEIQALKARATRQVEVVLAESASPDAFALPGVSAEFHGEGRWTFTVTGEIDPLIKRLAAYSVRDLEVTRASLEAIFMRYYAKEDA
jgi:ABC-2 type transport system ATP-binding protein